MHEHDPLCRSRMQEWEEIQVGYCPDCELIAKVREDERNK